MPLGAGLLAFVAQAKYDSFILEIITIASATSLLSRVVLGYWRLAQRYDSNQEASHGGSPQQYKRDLNTSRRLFTDLSSRAMRRVLVGPRLYGHDCTHAGRASSRSRRRFR